MTLNNLDKYNKIYKSNGFVVVKKFVKKNKAKNLKDKIINFLKKRINKYEGRDINFADIKKNIKNLHSFHRLHDFKTILNFSKTRKITSIAKLLIGTNKLELRASEFFAKPKKIGLNTPPHQDNFYWNVKKNKALTIWIALSESSKKNGGVYYYIGSHKKGILNHTPSYEKGTSQKIKDFNKLKSFRKFTPKLDVGDAIIHHCAVIHGSNQNKSNISRKGLTFQFKDRYSNYDKKKIRNYEKQLNFQIIKR